MVISNANLIGKDWLLRATLATLALGSLLLVGFVFLVWMLLSDAGLREDTIRAHALADRYVSSLQQIEESLAQNQPAAEIKQKLAVLQRLVPAGMRLEAVLANLEASHAAGLKLRSLSFDRDKGIARLKVTSQQPEQLFSWIESLADPGTAAAGWNVNLQSSEVDEQGNKVYLVHVKEK